VTALATTSAEFARAQAAESRPSKADAAAQPTTPSLRDMLEDGIYLLFLLRDGNAPKSCAEFNRRIDRFLANYDKLAKNFGKPPEEIEQGKYAFCALLDEIMLSSDFPLRDEWARMPVQLRLFDEHLAGEGFFTRLEELRGDTARHIESLEVFYTCLLLGFKGKYLIEGEEKLDSLVYRVGKEIRAVRGSAAEFAPNWKLPQRFQNFMRHEMPLWLYYGLMALGAAGLFTLLRVLLGLRIDKLFGG